MFILFYIYYNCYHYCTCHIYFVFQINLPKKSQATPLLPSPPAPPTTVLSPNSDVGGASFQPSRAQKPINTPVQDALRLTISNLKSDIVYLQNKKEQSIASDEQINQLKRSKAELKEAESNLKVKEQGQARQQKNRENQKRLLNDLKESNPEIAQLLSKRPKPGRPRAEEDQPELLKAIVDIATYGAGADERRRSETIRTIQTLDELTSELKLRGFKVKYSHNLAKNKFA
jgi:hypothetical protein